MHVFMYIHMYVYVCARIPVWTCCSGKCVVYVCVCAYIYIYIHITRMGERIHIHIYTNICMPGSRPTALRRWLHNGQVDVAAGGILYRVERDLYIDYSCMAYGLPFSVVIGPLAPRGEVTMEMVCMCVHIIHIHPP